MLTGMLVDDNPLLLNPAEGKQLDILYQDDDILVVNKSLFLSVPGKILVIVFIYVLSRHFRKLQGH